MIVLALDTSGTTASAALCRDGEVLAVRSAARPRAHGAAVTALLREALQMGGTDLGQVDGIGVAVGPGLFTGLRVGVVAAGVLGWARGLPVTGVGSLAAIAARVVRDMPPGAEFDVAIDARRREVFRLRFAAAGTAVAPPEVGAADAVPAGRGVAALFIDTGAERLGLPGTVVPTDALAAEVAVLAAAAFAAGEPQPVRPVYLRRPDVTIAGPPKSVLGAAGSR